MSRVWFSFFTSYSRICFGEHTAIQPHGETEVATSYGLEKNFCPDRCKWVSECEPNEAENTWKRSTAKEERRAEGCEELLDMDIIDEQESRIPREQGGVVERSTHEPW